MSIDIHFLTVLVERSAVECQYPGGLQTFFSVYPEAQYDADLVGVSVMSSVDSDDLLIDLARSGIDIHRHCATVDQMRGAIGDPGAGSILHRIRLRRRDGGRPLSSECYATWGSDDPDSEP